MKKLGHMAYGERVIVDNEDCEIRAGQMHFSLKGFVTPFRQR
jgi:hypothetical protein